MRRYRQIFALCSALWLTGQALATPVPESADAPPASYPTAIDLTTSNPNRSSLVVSPRDASGDQTLQPPVDLPIIGAVKAPDDSIDNPAPSPIPSELRGPSSAIDPSAITPHESRDMVSPGTDSPSNSAHGVTREFEIGAPAAPEPGSLGLLAGSALFLLWRRRNSR
ncbi:MAG TPA: PEP-CTERM sorting domain-containing protein [Tepidisphaeraceae bacterium]|nr:PEP-CTERM sorting domain-containing protein [Tepidisphaeraceae bacterium]